MRRVLPGILVLTLAMACSRKGQPPPDAAVAGTPGVVVANNAAVPADAAVERTSATTNASQPAMGLPSVKAVEFEQLKSFLPDLPGWTAENVRGEEVALPVPYSRAEARYRRGTSVIEVEITDTGMNPLLLAPISMFITPGYSERSDGAFKHATRIGGQPGAEDWNTRANRGEVTAIAGNRFLVRATGYQVADIASVRRVVETMNLARLSALR